MTELMVVIAILGILAGLSIRTFRTDTTSNDARKIAAMVSTAARLAVADGPVRADVVAACGIRARTQIEFTTVTVGTVQTNLVYVYEYREDPALQGATCSANNQWVSVVGEYLSNKAEIYAVGDVAQTQPDQALPGTTLGTGTVDKRFYADGTGDGFTVYIQNPLRTTTKFRIVSLKLQPTPQVFRDW